jgi:fructose-1,6-bisphosphatase/inositol monophosphatase family enzyme
VGAAAQLLDPIRALHDRIRAEVLARCAAQDSERLAEPVAQSTADTIYAIDRVSEGVLVAGLEEVAKQEPLVLVAEGAAEQGLALPRGTPEAECRWRVLMDPLDGTRGLMYQKRSGWILTGVAPNRGADTRLRDITLAVQTEIPLLKQHLADQLWAEKGGGARGVRVDVLRGTSTALELHPSRAETIADGFAGLVRFFPGARDVLAALDDEIANALVPPEAGKAACFEDQYLSTGGQLYELTAGHDRFIADLRPLVQRVLAERGLPRGLCCHPYDLAAALIAEEFGVVLTDPAGKPLDASLRVDEDVAWIGYANPALRSRVEPVLRRALTRL